MKLILVLSVVFLEILFVNLFKVVKVIRAFRINTLMDYEMLAILLWSKGMHAVRTPQLQA